MNWLEKATEAGVEGVRKHNFIDITGQTFNRLTALEYLGRCRWKCLCSCGTTCNIESTRLRKGRTRSCGCLAREVASTRDRTSRTIHGMHKSKEYAIWAAMHARCRNPNHKEWKNYGGRGVSVCEEWSEFIQFYKDMGPKPGKGYSLDRIDNVPIYSKDTCRWATDVEQHNNTRRNRLLTFRGRTQTAAEWARELGMRYSTLLGRLQNGWDVEAVLTTPPVQGKRS